MNTIGIKIFEILFLSWLLIIVNLTALIAQTNPIIEGSDIRPFTASGSIGLEANAYTASGIENRRAPSSLQSTANLNFTMFGLSSGLNLLYSTDQSSLRQNMNNLSFNASWNWLSVQAGDVSPNFSKYGINGVTVRGGYIKIAPNNWLLELSGGRSQRKVELRPADGFRKPAFERWSAAAKIGYESDKERHFFLSTHYSIDKRNSLDNPGALAPQENLTLTPDAKLTLFKGALTMETQVTFSAYTRDLNTAEIPLQTIGVPGFLSSIMTAYESSRINYAGEATLGLDLNQFGLELGYQRVQPGFVSLGTSRTRDDQQEIQISPSIQFFDNRLSLKSNVVLGRDNLLGSRLQTQRNANIGSNIQFQLSDMININGNYNLLINDFSSGNLPDTTMAAGFALGQRQVAHTITLQPSFTFQKAEYTHSISVSGSYFTFNNEFDNTDAMPTGGIQSDTYSSSVSYSLTFPVGLSLNTAGNFLRNTSDNASSTTLSSNIGASYSFLQRKMTMSLNGGFSQNTSESTNSNLNSGGISIEANQLMLNMTANYRLTNKDSFSLTMRSRRNSIVKGGNSDFSEIEGSFRYQHRF